MMVSRFVNAGAEHLVKNQKKAKMAAPLIEPVVLPTPQTPTTTAPAGAPAAAPAANTYKVKSGDYMGKIASGLKISLSELKAANPQITNFNLIEVGDVLNLPQ